MTVGLNDLWAIVAEKPWAAELVSGERVGQDRQGTRQFRVQAWHGDQLEC